MLSTKALRFAVGGADFGTFVQALSGWRTCPLAVAGQWNPGNADARLGVSLHRNIVIR